MDFKSRYPSPCSPEILDWCEDQVLAELAKYPKTAYSIASELRFTNKPEDVGAFFDQCIDQISCSFEPKALYTEMNGFFINPDRWYFDIFGYDSFEEFGDADWLSDWQSPCLPEFSLTGMEGLQEVYEQFSKQDNRNPLVDAITPVVDLFVLVRFQKLIRSAIPHMQRLKCRLFATAHEYDVFYAYSPKPAC